MGLEQFFGLGIMEQKYLDRWLYRGKGRPRTSDYSTISVLQRKLNAETNKRIDSQLFGLEQPTKNSGGEESHV